MRETLPCDLEMEKSIIGHVLSKGNSAALDAISLDASHFFDPTNRAIWEAIKFLDGIGRPCDPVSVASRLNDEKKLNGIGGTSQLVELGLGTPYLGETVLRSYVARLTSLWKARQFIGACQVGQAEMRDGGLEDVEGVIHRFDSVITELITTASKHEPVSFHDAVEGAIKSITSPDHSVATKTGFSNLDRHIGGGLHPGDLVIVAGRPGMGKTAFLLNLLINIARKDNAAPCAMFSLEMPLLQLATRVLCTEASLKMSDVRSGNITPDGWSNLTDAATNLSNVRLWIDDSSGISIQELRSKIRHIKRRARKDGIDKQLCVVGIDYLQLMRGEKSQNREQEVSGITRALKALAKEENVCIVVLSQLNREVEKQSGRRPQLKDLRESGAIEQDADMVLFLYRAGYYDADEDQKEAEIIIAKQRNGETMTVKAFWDAIRMRYTDLEYGTYEDLDPATGDWIP